MSAAHPVEALARWCLWQAVWPPVAILIGVIVAVSAGMPGPAPATLPRTAALLLCLTAGCATFGLSAIVLFDALLFRLIASYGDGDKGGAAVDDLLARMRLKPLPSITRPLDSRAAGTRRLVARQRAAFALFVAAAFAALA